MKNNSAADNFGLTTVYIVNCKIILIVHMLWFVVGIVNLPVQTQFLRQFFSEFGTICEQLLRSCVCTVCSQTFPKSPWFVWVCACAVVVFYFLIKYIWCSSLSHYFLPTHTKLWPNCRKQTLVGSNIRPTRDFKQQPRLRQRNWLYSKTNIRLKVHILWLFPLALILWDCWQSMLPTDWLRRRWSKYRE